MKFENEHLTIMASIIAAGLLASGKFKGVDVIDDALTIAYQMAMKHEKRMSKK